MSYFATTEILWFLLDFHKKCIARIKQFNKLRIPAMPMYVSSQNCVITLSDKDLLWNHLDMAWYTAESLTELNVPRSRKVMKLLLKINMKLHFTRLNCFNVSALILSWFRCWTNLFLSWFCCWTNLVLSWFFCWSN